MDISETYPELAKQLELLRLKRRDEILSSMMETDKTYEELCRRRADMSMALKEVLRSVNADALLEAYSDAVYAQEVYELDAIYKQALCDTLEVLKKQGLL